VPAHPLRPPLVLRPGLSRRLAALIGATHAAALGVCMLLPLSWWWRSLLLILVLVSLADQIGLHLLRRLPWAVREASWSSDGEWILTLASGRQLQAVLGPSTYVAPSLVVLNFRCGRWRRCALVLLPDNLDATLLRRLRARLRLAGADKAGNAAVSQGPL
jgi:toxin CptA